MFKSIKLFFTDRPYYEQRKRYLKRQKAVRKKLKKQKHTPNTPHYSYVDDFKTYVERTYKKMDKFK
jgi:hypothetical protein